MREETYGWNLEMQMKAARAGLRILEIPVEPSPPRRWRIESFRYAARHVCRRRAHHRDGGAGGAGIARPLELARLCAGTTNSAAKRAGRAVSKEKFHLAIPAVACTVAHAFDAGIGEVLRHAANPRAV